MNRTTMSKKSVEKPTMIGKQQLRRPIRSPGTPSDKPLEGMDKLLWGIRWTVSRAVKEITDSYSGRAIPGSVAVDGAVAGCGRRRRPIYISHAYSDRADRENSSATPEAGVHRSNGAAARRPGPSDGGSLGGPQPS